MVVGAECRPMSQSERIYHQTRGVRNRVLVRSKGRSTRSRRGPDSPICRALPPSTMPFHEHRRLIQALALSALVHAALLLDVVRIYPPELGAPAIAMKVVIEQTKPPDPRKTIASAPDKPQEAPLSVAAPRREPRKAPPVPPKSEARRVPAEIPRIAVREPSPVVAPATTVSADVPADFPRADVTDVAPAAVLPLATAAGAAVAGDAPSAREGVSADDLRLYRVSLASAARRFKRYPALAREQGWEGTAEVALRFRAALPSPEVVLVRSSGRDLLDEQAVAMLAQAARVTTLPESMRGSDFQIPLPVKFSLDELQ